MPQGKAFKTSASFPPDQGDWLRAYADACFSGSISDALQSLVADAMRRPDARDSSDPQLLVRLASYLTPSLLQQLSALLQPHHNQPAIVARFLTALVELLRRNPQPLLDRVELIDAADAFELRMLAHTLRAHGESAHEPIIRAITDALGPASPGDLDLASRAQEIAAHYGTRPSAVIPVPPAARPGAERRHRAG